MAALGHSRRAAESLDSSSLPDKVAATFAPDSLADHLNPRSFGNGVDIIQSQSKVMDQFGAGGFCIAIDDYCH